MTILKSDQVCLKCLSYWTAITPKAKFISSNNATIREMKAN